MRKSKLPIGFLSLTMALCTAFSFNIQTVQAKMSNEASELYTQAVKFEDQGRIEDALDLILKALNTSDNDIVLTTKLGGLYAQIGELNKAAETYTKAIQLNPEDAFLHISIANIYQQQGKYDEAFNSYYKAMNLNPNYRHNYLNLANAKYMGGYYEEAIKYYRIYLQDYPKSIDARCAIASSYLNLKEYKKATAEFIKAKEINPNAFKDYSNLGLAYLRDKEYNLAKDAFLKAVEINPSDYMAYGNLAVVQTHLKENNQALENYKKAFSLHPELENLKFDYASLLASIGKTDEAIAAYQEYIKAYPEDSNAYLNLGILYRDTNNTKYSIAVLQEGVKKSKGADNGNNIKNELAKSYYQNKEYAEAISIYDSILLMEPTNLRALFNKGLCLSGNSRYNEADRIFKRVSQISDYELQKYQITREDIKKSISGNMTLQANSLKNKKEYDKAKELYSKAIETDIKNTEAYLGLAKTYEGMNDKPKTIETYEQIINIEPDNNDVLIEYGETLSKMNEDTKAQDTFKKIIANDANSYEARISLADSYTKVKNHQSALNEYLEALKCINTAGDSADDALYIKIGNAYKYLQDGKNAIVYYNKALEIDPGNENAYFNIGLVKYDNNEISAALEYFRKAINLKKDFAFAWWAAGACYEKSDKPDDAIYHYEKFIEYSDDEELIKSTKEKINSLYSSLAY